MSFDQFNNLVKLYRDEFWASQNVDMFIYDIGVSYNVWTVGTKDLYLRKVFFDEIKKPLSISFEIPDAKKNSFIPVNISIYDEDGIYFTQEQRIMVSRFVNGKFRKSSWRKVPSIRDFVLGECTVKTAARA